MRQFSSKSATCWSFRARNPFRVRAYRNAARTIHDLPEAVADIAADPARSLTQLEGVGKDLADKLVTLLKTGTLPMLDELCAEVPESVLAILRVPGLGPKRAAQLYHELNVGTLDELRAAAQSQKIRDLKGFGAKMEAAILQGLDIASEAGRRILWVDADQHVQEILAYMENCKAVPKIAAAGSYRRGKETVGDLDFLAVTRDVEAAMDRLAHYGGVASVLARGETKMSLRLAAGVQVDLRAVPAESFGAALQYFTGSKEHNIVLRGRAKAKGLKINEYGVFRGEKRIAGRTEEEVYATLDLPCFPPELREARREFDWADAGELPTLVELGDIRGDLHTHSTWTDGTASIEEMAAAAKQRGLKYFAVTDHSKRVTMVGGLDAARLRRQWAEIDQLNQRLRGITVLRSVEVDILERGGLDLPDDLLAEADWVVASVHYGQQQSREQITKRVIGALENPNVDASGASDRADAAPAEALCHRLGGGHQGRPAERQDSGVERSSLATRSGRRGLRGGQKRRRSDRDFDRCPSSRGAGCDALRHPPGSSRRPDEGRRGQHPHLAATKEDAQEGVAPRRPSPSGDGDAAASVASVPDTITGMHPHCRPADRQTRLKRTAVYGRCRRRR